jgi:hypothetical protein
MKSKHVEVSYSFQQHKTCHVALKKNIELVESNTCKNKKMDNLLIFVTLLQVNQKPSLNCLETLWVSKY